MILKQILQHKSLQKKKKKKKEQVIKAEVKV